MKIRNSLKRLGLKPWLLIVVLTMTGCASGPPFQKVNDIPDGKALVYIYRSVPTLMHGAGATPHVVINNLNAIPLEPGGYYPYFSAPGEMMVSITHWAPFPIKRSIAVNVYSGETYYIKAGTNFMLGTPYIESVPAGLGLSEISECNRLPDVPGV